MTNTTASEGFLKPTETSFDADDPLIDVFGAVVAGVLGFERNFVRPRFQLGAPPQMPGSGQDWCALGVSETSEASVRGIIKHVPDGDGHDEVQTPERIEVLLSFYGPSATTNARRLRDGLKVQQNRDGLRACGLAYQGSGSIVVLGEQINASWYRRSDMTVRLDGIVVRSFGVLNLLSAHGSFVSIRSVEGGPAVLETENWSVEA